jgi:hypothetical protein
VVHLKINTIYINAPAPGHAGGVPVRIAPEADSRAVRSEVEHSGAALAQNDLIIYAGSHPSEEGTAGHEDSDRLRFRIADLPYDLPRIGLAGWAMPPRPARTTKNFEIIGSRRLGLSTCEFDVVAESSRLVVGDFFPIKERGSLREYVVVSVEPQAAFVTLGCVAWIPADGAFVGTVVSTRPMTAVDKRRWAKALPEHFFEQTKPAG